MEEKILSIVYNAINKALENKELTNETCEILSFEDKVILIFEDKEYQLTIDTIEY